MAFDQKTRNLLQRTITACRRVFDREFTAQLQELYGIQPDGTLTQCAMLDHLADEELEVARLLRSRLNHLEGGEPSEALTRTRSKPENVARVIREQAFTVLNRLAALRLCEERGLVLECVRQGVNSEGFQLFMTIAGNALGETHEAYLVYLSCLFDELALDLGVLFDRFSPLALLFPRKDALEEVLRELNGTGKAAENEAISAEQFGEIWKADETIGWTYQYYNDEAERKRMRELSSAPRNSRELAVRNQFFTPRYVVEFLTDNTLGRIWYEMRHGQTVLRDRCTFLVRRPTEVFLKLGEAAPESLAGNEASQEELLRQPVHIPHRPLKDPREIRLLDPACGSMHFGLYAFDLLSVIYDEAWEIAHGPDEVEKSAEGFAPFVVFVANFSDKAAYLLQVPRLIIEHNIHGIDIDPRAVQIAGLSLWLRAQRAWHQAGIRPADRPRITRSNIVCAEPMPGEKKLLREFVDQQFDAYERPAFAFLLEKIFDHMSLAGEAGALLRIEEEIRSAVSEASVLARSQPLPRQAPLFPGDEKPEPVQFELQGLGDEHFWQRAEQRIYDALEAYAEQAENGGGFQRRLFAEDAAQGFAFIDLCRKRYDVVVMNPPFGDASLPSKSYIDDTYGDTKGDVYKAFVECFNARLHPAGYLGIISSRTGFFLSGGEDWRTRVVLRLFRPTVLADLGSGVLDAMVEVAAYVLRSLSVPEARDLTLSLVPVLERVVRDRQDRFSLPKWQAARDGLKRHQAIAELEHLEVHGFVLRSPGDIVRYTPLWQLVKKVAAPPEPVFPPLVCIRALAENDKGGALVDAIQTVANDGTPSRVYVVQPESFAQIPGTPFAYWASESLRDVFDRFPEFEGDGRIVRQGGVTGNDARYLRAWWEVPAEDRDVRELQWVPFAKGGNYSPYFSDCPVVVRWDYNRVTFFGYTGLPHRPSEKPSSADLYFSKGLTWPLRAPRFAPVPLPSNAVFSIRGYAILAPLEQLLPLLSLGNSSVFDFIFKLALGRFGYPEFVVGVLQKLPLPLIAQADQNELARLGRLAWAEKRSIDTAEAIAHPFIVPSLLAMSGRSLAERANAWGVRLDAVEGSLAATQAKIDNIALRLYELTESDRSAFAPQELTSDVAESTVDADTEDDDFISTSADVASLSSDLISYFMGSAFGRWDFRYATGERSAPELPDPFAPLPVSSPGMLQGDDGLPLSHEAGRRLRAEGRYPLDVAWEGILVDDPEHPLDLGRHVHAAFVALWADRADLLEHEACELLGVPTLREWFRRPADFFADHLKRHSKSKRQAPIYWPLSVGSGRYTLWLYYHRLTPDSLYKCLQQFVLPKLVDIEKELAHLRTVLAAGEGGVKERNRSGELEDLRQELIELRVELELWAPKWKPNLNDGVLIAAAPLWKLFRLPKWQKDLNACWQKLENGDYDWAHLAYSLWPDRVRDKCKTDRSLAIAHGLEEICEVKAPVKKVKKSKKPKPEDIQQELPKE